MEELLKKAKELKTKVKEGMTEEELKKLINGVEETAVLAATTTLMM